MGRNCCLGLLMLFCLARITCFATDDTGIAYLGIEQGLSNNAVTSIYQDHNGFLWFGTYDGLNRYDGYGFKIFRNVIGDKTSLADNHISSIESDAAHNLWIGCENALSIYNPVRSTFSSLQYKSLNGPVVDMTHLGVNAIQNVNNGTWMLVGVKSKGLFVFEKGSQTGLQIPLEVAKGAEGNYEATALAFDAQRQITWVFVKDFGLFQYNVKTKRLLFVNGKIKNAECLKVDSRGTLWLGCEEGLFQYDNTKNAFSQNLLPASYKVMNLMEDRQRVLWIASDGGGVWTVPIDGSIPAPYLSTSGSPKINSNAVYAIYEDHEGGKWFGTLRGGINVVKPRTSAFRHITCPVSVQKENDINNFILSFCEDDTHNLWIGTDGAGLRYWNRQKNAFISFVHDASNPSSISSNFVTNILRDSVGDTWFTTWFGGVNRLRKGAKSFEHFSCRNPKTGSVENNAWLVFEDKRRRLWVSTTNDGTLYLFNRMAVRFELFDKSISNLQCLAEERNGEIWGGNYSSVINIDPVNKRHKTFPVGNTVRCIHEDKAGNFWIGTDGGGLLLFNRATGRFTRFTTSEGLPSNTVLRMLEDRSGNLWLSTYNGLCKFNPATKSCRNFSQSDGLQSNQFSFNAALVLQSGEFLFGGIKGFNIFYPDSVQERKEMPPVFLTGLRVNNKSVEEDSSFVTERNFEKLESVSVPYDHAFLSLDFVALEYSGADKVQYAYTLEGWDKSWNRAGNSRTANYARLKEGTYSFKIKVTNAAGIWGGETTLLTITVLPPWYRSWWAYLLYLAIAGAAIYSYMLYNRREERLKYEVKLALLEKEKEKEITEKKISFFTHISHEFRTPLTLIINPLKELMTTHATEKDRKQISTVYRNARRLLSLVDQLLLFRKVESVEEQLRIEKFDLAEACREVFLSFSQHALCKTIDFSFHHDEGEVLIYGDKEKIEIILFNLLSNAFKYTEAGGKIALIITETESGFLIKVSDTGCGIPVETGEKLFDSFYRVNQPEGTKESGFGVGLYVSRKLAEAHKGELTYKSTPGAGTEFCLRLLKGKEHYGAAYISEDYKSGKTILSELVEEVVAEKEAPEIAPVPNKSAVLDKLRSDLPVMLVVDDNAEMRSYIVQVFSSAFTVYEAADGAEGYELAVTEIPDIVISDVMMKNVSGIELCQKIKSNPAVAHIPVVLLTGSASDKAKLEGIQGGAEDYILKPFDKEIIQARIENILKERSRMKQYFFNAVTLKPASNLSGEHKVFIEKCIAIVEAHIDNPEFAIGTFCREIGMSHPSLYKKVKAVSGLTVNVFIRYIRLRKAAELLLSTDKTILEVTYLTGFNDVRYFREQFQKLFHMNPSDYVKRYRKVLGSKPTSN